LNGLNGQAKAWAYVPADVTTGPPPGGLSTGVTTIQQAEAENGPVTCFDLEAPAFNAVATIDFASVLFDTGHGDQIYVALPVTAAGASVIANDCPDGVRDAAAYYIADPGDATAFFIAFN